MSTKLWPSKPLRICLRPTRSVTLTWTLQAFELSFVIGDLRLVWGRLGISETAGKLSCQKPFKVWAWDILAWVNTCWNILASFLVIHEHVEALQQNQRSKCSMCIAHLGDPGPPSHSKRNSREKCLHLVKNSWGVHGKHPDVHLCSKQPISRQMPQSHFLVPCVQASSIHGQQKCIYRTCQFKVHIYLTSVAVVFLL